MYYEEREPRRRKKRRRSRYEGPGLFGRLLRLLIVLVVVCSIGAAGWTVVAHGGWTDVLLLGIDYDANGTSRSDTMIIASVGPLGQVRLTSVMRDTWVDIPGHNPNKINAAYRFGGPELAMETVNAAFGTDIKHYAAVSVRAFPLLIDALGGVDISVTKEEMAETNKNLATMRALLKKTGADTSDLTVWGDNVHLTGAQALSFARIRSIGSDYQRTSRQRAVLSAMLDSARSCRNPAQIVGFVQKALEVVDTNVHWPHMITLGVFAMVNNDVEQLRLPADGACEDGKFDGVWCIRPDLDKNRAILREFLQY